MPQTTLKVAVMLRSARKPSQQGMKLDYLVHPWPHQRRQLDPGGIGLRQPKVIYFLI